MNLFEKFLKFCGKSPAQIMNILDFLGMHPTPALRSAAAASRLSTQQGGKQVYYGKSQALPAFARGVAESALVEACVANVACEYTPHIEQQRLYATTADYGFDGNLPIEYEGIAANCGAVKKVGMTVAKQEKNSQPYRYVDRAHVLACCCGTPDDCPFYEAAVAEREEVERKMRKLRDQEEEAEKKSSAAQ